MTIQNQQTDSLLEFRKIMEVGLASLAAEKADEADPDAKPLFSRGVALMSAIQCSTSSSFWNGVESLYLHPGRCFIPGRALAGIVRAIAWVEACPDPSRLEQSRVCGGRVRQFPLPRNGA